MICISGLKLFTGESIQASLHFPLSLICDWQSDGFKHFCPNGSLSCFVLPSLCLRYTATWHMLCVLRAEAASRQTEPGWTRTAQGSRGGCECSQITGQSVQRADPVFSLTELTIGAGDPVLGRHTERTVIIHKCLCNDPLYGKTIP